MEEIREYKGWEDSVVSFIPHETYVKISKFHGVVFLGNSRFLGVFIPDQIGENPGLWEPHWFAKCPGIIAYRSAKKALAEFFKINYNAYLIGVTDCNSKEALKMAKLLGFVAKEIMLVDGIPHVISILEGDK